ncbi:hypothetical protein LTR05_004085 [Lithohypha guttulata]|uniref:Spindle pole body component n=1 Tax=Lithohypha guttulata TaxID=1690604 RepID=A0AAN7T195_9EURO|nr:hypothetical protein LTR05_004085 [Lithohypha guttulata]
MGTDPFSSEGITELQPLHLRSADAWCAVEFDASPENEFLHLAEVPQASIHKLQPSILRLKLAHESLERIDIDDSTSTKSEHTPSHIVASQSYEDDVNIWTAVFTSPAKSRHELLSWDHFNGHNNQLQKPVFLTETAPKVYDAFISRIWRSKHDTRLKYADVDHMRHALVNLMLGRNSRFFMWDNTSSAFRLSIDDISLAGLTPEFTRTVCDRFISLGSDIRRLKNFCDLLSTTSTVCALQSSIVQVVYGIEQHFAAQVAGTTTILQLHDNAELYIGIVGLLSSLTGLVDHAVDEKTLLTAVLAALDEAWFSANDFQYTINILAAAVVEPVLRKIGEQLRMPSEQTVGTANVLLSDLLPQEMDVVSETTECLLVAHKHDPQSQPHAAKPLESMTLVYRWEDIVEMQRLADELEDNLKAFPRGSYSNATPHILQEVCSISEYPFQVDFDLLPNNLMFEAGNNDKEEAATPTIRNLIFKALMLERAENEPDLSPLQSLKLSLTPSLQAQHRIATYTLLKTMFIDHNLAMHLEALYAFPLLGSGSFATRLSRALFDAGQNSATGLNAGLGLDNRETWPPATSEIRLALTGLFLDSESPALNREVLGCLSFAIRDLAEEELEYCRDVHSLHVLDFLKLNYSQPNHIIELVITPTILDRYDRVFKFLLILLRLHALAQKTRLRLVRKRQPRHLPIQSNKLCTEVHHFVSTLVDFVLNTATKLPVMAFLNHTKRIHYLLLTDKYEESMNIVKSISQLRNYHEEILDEVLEGLLLGEKQTKAYQLTCSILSLCLEILSDLTSSEAANMSRLSKEFGSQMQIWLHKIRLLAKSPRPALRRLEHLCLALDLSGYCKS